MKTPNRQSGVVLFIALIVLVALSLAGLATMRSVDTAALVAGGDAQGCGQMALAGTAVADEDHVLGAGDVLARSARAG